MRITADTNLLVRVLVGDDPEQAASARRVLLDADLVAAPVTALCELCWVLSRRYGVTRSELVKAIRTLIEADNVVVDRRAVDAGLLFLESGGDFADGVIAYEGARLGGVTFVSFDREAVRAVAADGGSTLLL